MVLAEQERWQLYVSRADSLGGRALRRQLSLDGHVYKILEEADPQEQTERKKGLFLPFLEIEREQAADWLPQVALALQNARAFRRVVLLLREPIPEVLALLSRHQERGLSCTAVCTEAYSIYGGERPEEKFSPVEQLMDLLIERTDSASPRKRLQLPYREDADLRLVFAGDLAGAALFVMMRDEGLEPLLVEGQTFPYREVAELAKKAAGFEGRLQFGKEKLPKRAEHPAGLRVMQGKDPYKLADVLVYLNRKRRRQGKVFLSACIIMRDSEEDIGRCLESLKDVDEIIVVDTGSVDNSVEIAKKYTDKVYHFQWIKDFSAAKNFALEKAQGDWIVYPDSDEFFTEGTEMGLRRLVQDFDGPGMLRQLLVRRMEGNKELEVIGAEGSASRIFSQGLHYLGAVHEVLVDENEERPMPVMVPRERCVMMHTGYDPSRIADKVERNSEILRHAHETGHDIPLQHYCMGKNLLLEGKPEEARQEMMLALEAESMPVSFRADIYRTWYNASQQLGDEQGMKDAVAAMRKDMPMMPDSYGIEGVALWNEGKKEEAAPLLLKSVEYSLDFLRLNPGETNLVGKDMPSIAQALLEFYEEKGEQEMAAKIKNYLTRM